MTTKLLFSLVLTTFIFSLSAQEYQPLVIEGAHWQVNYQPSEPSDDANYPDDSYGFSIEGDSTFNEVIYKKVYKFDLAPFYSENIFNPDSLYVEGKYLFGLLREDIITRKVYSVIFDENDWMRGCQNASEQLLYDFSIGIGDTVMNCTSPGVLDFNTGNASHFIVENISIENTWGESRKIFRQNIYDSTEERLIEGMGYGGILFYEATLFPQTLDWKIEFWDYCVGTDQECLIYLVDGVNDLSLKKQVKLYPNPTHSNQIQIESLDKLPKNTVIHLFNAIGQEISRVQLAAKIQTLELPYVGVFYYKIVAENQIIDAGMVERF